MASRTDWLKQGLLVLARDGASGLRIDHLSAAMRLSKGSFYHHFTGMPDFKTALLDHYESTFTTRYIDLVDAEPDLQPLERLRRLLDLVLESGGEPHLDIAVRAWAMHDAEVQATQERIDHARLGFLQQTWFDLSADAAESALMGRLLYVILVGAEQVRPPVSPDELRGLYDLVLRPAHDNPK